MFPEPNERPGLGFIIMPQHYDKDVFIRSPDGTIIGVFKKAQFSVTASGHITITMESGSWISVLQDMYSKFSYDDQELTITLRQ